MIIGTNIQYQTVEDEVREDFGHMAESDLLEDTQLENIIDDDDFIPMELIPTELIDIDTDNMTCEQEELWNEIKIEFTLQYRELWYNKIIGLLGDRLNVEADAVKCENIRTQIHRLQRQKLGYSF